MAKRKHDGEKTEIGSGSDGSITSSTPRRGKRQQGTALSQLLPEAGLDKHSHVRVDGSEEESDTGGGTHTRRASSQVNENASSDVLHSTGKMGLDWESGVSNRGFSNGSKSLGVSRSGVLANGSAARSYSLVDRDAWSFQFKKIKPGFTVHLKASSVEGLRVGQDKEEKKGSLYMRFQKGGIPDFLKQVDTISDTLYAEATELIWERFSLDPARGERILLIKKNGWEEATKLETGDKKAGSELVLFPHAQFSKLGQIRDGKIVPIKSRSLFAHVDRLANSEWVVEISINAVRVEYQEKRGWITITPFFSVKKIYYMNVGQDMVLDPDEVERLKEEREERENAALLKFASSK